MGWRYTSIAGGLSVFDQLETRNEDAYLPTCDGYAISKAEYLLQGRYFCVIITHMTAVVRS